MTVLPQEVIFTGTQINYYFICKTKLWFFSHFISMESGSDIVRIGKLIHEKAYSRVEKDVIIDDRIAIDFIHKGDRLIIHEIKKSRKMDKAHRYQLYYYLYYLKNKKGISSVVGEIDYPKERKREYLTLSEEIEKEIEDIMEEIKVIVSKASPPKPERKKTCRRCSYYELCWV